MAAKQTHCALTVRTAKAAFRRFSVLDGLEMLSIETPGTEFPLHAHDEYVFTLVYVGAEPVGHGGQVHLVPEGAVIALNPGEWHSNRLLPGVGVAYKSIYPPTSLIKSFTANLSLGDARFHQPIWQDRSVSRALAVLHRALESDSSVLECETAFLYFLVSLLEAQATLRTAQRVWAEPVHVARVREYLAENFAHRTTLNDLSDLTGISPFHLLRIFRDTVGAPPHQFQNHLRIEEAKRLLREGIAAGQVATEVGFADQSHLTRRFQQVVGVTPGEFARNRNSVQA